LPWHDGYVAHLRKDQNGPDNSTFIRLASRRNYALGKIIMPLIAALGLIAFGSTYIYAALLFL